MDAKMQPLIDAIVSKAVPGHTWYAVGWYNEKTKEVVHTSSMRHYDILKRPEFGDAYSEYEDVQAEKAEAQDQFIDQFVDDDHVPWHAWSDLEFDEKNKRIFERVFDAGWIRWGFFSSPYKVTLDVTAPYPKWRIDRADGTSEELTMETRARDGDRSIDITPKRFNDVAETLSAELDYYDSRW